MSSSAQKTISNAKMANVFSMVGCAMVRMTVVIILMKVQNKDVVIIKPDFSNILHYIHASGVESNNKTCAWDQWACTTDPSQCIPLEQVCDGKPNCPKGGDEGPGCGMANIK